VASPTSNGGAASGTIPAVVGKVTPVRYDGRQQDTSGQEEKRAHFCAIS
jgi:putative transposase